MKLPPTKIGVTRPAETWALQNRGPGRGILASVVRLDNKFSSSLLVASGSSPDCVGTWNGDDTVVSIVGDVAVVPVVGNDTIVSVEAIFHSRD